jgi:hypothetical protein
MTTDNSKTLASYEAVLDEVIYQAIRMRPGLSGGALSLDPTVIMAVGPGRQHSDAVAQSLERLRATGSITFERIEKMYITLYRNLRPAE